MIPPVKYLRVVSDDSYHETRTPDIGQNAKTHPERSSFASAHPGVWFVGWLAAVTVGAFRMVHVDPIGLLIVGTLVVTFAAGVRWAR